jgi:hypothetical protein
MTETQRADVLGRVEAAGLILTTVIHGTLVTPYCGAAFGLPDEIGRGCFDRVDNDTNRDVQGGE